MASTKEAAAKIFEGFERSNGTFRDDRLVDEDTIASHRQLTGSDRQQSDNVDRAVSQLIAAIGSDIEHSVIVNAPNPDRSSRSYHFAVFSPELLGYVEFTSAGEDPKILVRTVPRSSITEIEIRSAKDYRSDEDGSLVFVVNYASGITLDIRERDNDGKDVSVTKTWLQELLESLRRDLASV